MLCQRLKYLLLITIAACFTGLQAGHKVQLQSFWPQARHFSTTFMKVMNSPINSHDNSSTRKCIIGLLCILGNAMALSKGESLIKEQRFLNRVAYRAEFGLPKLVHKRNQTRDDQGISEEDKAAVDRKRTFQRDQRNREGVLRVA